MSASPEERRPLKRVIRAILRGAPPKLISTEANEVAKSDTTPMATRLEQRKIKLEKRRLAAEKVAQMERERADYTAAEQLEIVKALDRLEGPGQGKQKSGLALRLTPTLSRRSGQPTAASAAATAAAAAMVASRQAHELESRRRREEKQQEAAAKVAEQRAALRASGPSPHSETDDDFHSAESGSENGDKAAQSGVKHAAPPPNPLRIVEGPSEASQPSAAPQALDVGTKEASVDPPRQDPAPLVAAPRAAETNPFATSSVPQPNPFVAQSETPQPVNPVKPTAVKASAKPTAVQTSAEPVVSKPPVETSASRPTKASPASSTPAQGTQQRPSSLEMKQVAAAKRTSTDRTPLLADGAADGEVPASEHEATKKGCCTIL